MTFFLWTWTLNFNQWPKKKKSISYLHYISNVYVYLVIFQCTKIILIYQKYGKLIFCDIPVEKLSRLYKLLVYVYIYQGLFCNSRPFTFSKSRIKIILLLKTKYVFIYFNRLIRTNKRFCVQKKFLPLIQALFIITFKF